LDERWKADARRGWSRVEWLSRTSTVFWLVKHRAAGESCGGAGGKLVGKDPRWAA
jgi:hypothetical protein